MQSIRTLLKKRNHEKEITLESRIIAHIDMDSYFATVEQQANPALRGKPIAVSGKFIPEKLNRSIVAAASVEAKRWGVRTPLPLYEAKRICPDLIIIPGDPDKYETVTKKFLAIFERYTPEIEIFSIDEAFLDLTDVITLLNPPLAGGEREGFGEEMTEKKYEEAAKIARKIKKQIRSEIGGWISCSVGIGPNKMIAKLASEQKKPDGLTVVRPRNVLKLLEEVELTDICGIAGRIKRRLNNLGIKKPLDMGKVSERLLTNEFGVWGKIFKLWGQGIDPTPIVPYYLAPPAKSIGHSYTLPQDSRDFSEIEKYFYCLSDKVGRRLRKEGYGSRCLSLFIRLSDFFPLGESKRYKFYFNDSFKIYELAFSIFKKWRFQGSVRMIGISASDLVKIQNLPYPLLPKERKIERALKAQDKINDKFGELTIARGAFFKTKLKKQVGGFFEREKLLPKV